MDPLLSHRPSLKTEGKLLLVNVKSDETSNKIRKRRYLTFTSETQWGVYAAVSVPINSLSYVSVAWFYEANYYTVDNATYFDPFLGDIYTVSSRRKGRSFNTFNDVLTRTKFYKFTETNLERHGYPGHACLLRAICENADNHFLHNGLLGDLIYLILTPSTSAEEDIDDSYYEAEYHGLDQNCEHYTEDCPSNPLEQFSVNLNDVEIK